MLSVNPCGCGQLVTAKKSALGFLQRHPLLLNKNPITYRVLRNQRFPNWVSCLLQSFKLNSQTVNNSLDEEERGEEKKVEEEVDLFTVSYLIKSCGLSEKEAISASKKTTLKNRANADSVLVLFREHGFSDAQISLLVKRHPLVLKSNPDKILLPKLEFFQSIGFKSAANLGKFVSTNPNVLIRSVKYQYKPSYDILKNVLNSDELVYTTVSRCSWLLLNKLPRNFVPNVEVLRDAGVPQSRINTLVLRFPMTILENHSQFREAVIRVKEMGFDPSLSAFIDGVRVLSGRRGKVLWEQCYETYMNLGCSSDEIMSAFRKRPLCMLVSEEKIRRVMDFLVNKMGWPSSDITKRLHVFQFSLEKRIIPRCSVVHFLHSKGLLERLPKLSTILDPPNHQFMTRYVTTYVDKVPEVLQLYEGKLNYLDK